MGRRKREDKVAADDIGHSLFLYPDFGFDPPLPPVGTDGGGEPLTMEFAT